MKTNLVNLEMQHFFSALAVSGKVFHATNAAIILTSLLYILGDKSG